MYPRTISEKNHENSRKKNDFECVVNMDRVFTLEKKEAHGGRPQRLAKMVLYHTCLQYYPCTESMTKNNSPIFLPPFPHGRAEANMFLRVMSENLGVMSK